MAKQENVTILSVETREAVKSISDLRENIKYYKDILEKAEVGSRQFELANKHLKENQNALKDAMYNTTQSMQDLTASANGTAESYNGLVHRMAQLKQELRAVDVSTDEGMEHFKDLASQVNEVNDKLKYMDELQGNFQRNVGNYPNLAKTWSTAFDQLDKGLKASTKGVGGLKDGFDSLNKNPIMFTIGLLVSAFVGLKDTLQENEQVMGSVQKAGMSLEPIFRLVKVAVEKVAEWVSIAIGKMVEFYDNSKETFKGIISGAVGVGNALLQSVLAPIRTIIDGFKGLGNIIKAVFEKDFDKAKEVASQTASSIGENYKKGFSFKANFEQGKQIGEDFIAGLADLAVKSDAEQAGADLADIFGASFDKEMAKFLNDVEKELDAEFQDWAKNLGAEEDRINKINAKLADNRLKTIDRVAQHQLNMNNIMEEDEIARADKAYEIQLDANQKRLDALKQFADEALANGDLESLVQYEQSIADLELEMEENKYARMRELRERDLADAQAKKDAQVQTLFAIADATSSVLNSIADMYEQDEENAEENAEKVKALRIAGATIDTITGAVGAFMQAVKSLPAPYGAIVGAVQSAMVTATGIAQINKIRSTNAKGSSSASGASISAPAMASAPQMPMDIPQVRNITSATDEERLNQMAGDQRVKLVMSDLEVKQGEVRVQMAESSF